MSSMGEIARVAGVSRATVSYVLNQRVRSGGTVSAETTERVLETARQLGYRRNQIARAANAKHARIIAALSGSADGETGLRLLAGAFASCAEAGYLLKLLPGTGEPDAMKTAVERCLEWRVAGVLGYNFDATGLALLARRLKRERVPLVCVDCAEDTPGNLCLGTDEMQCMRLVVEHLKGQGRRRIALLTGGDEGVGLRRERSFAAVMAEAGLEPHPASPGRAPWHDVPAIDAEAERLLAGARPPDAVVCAGDALAMRVQAAARRLGLAMPERLAVLGFSDSPFAPFADPPLTSIDQSFHAMGRAACEALIAAAGTPPRRRETRFVPGRLVVRASTGVAVNASRE
jgi:LacI family transcriptional regulator